MVLLGIAVLVLTVTEVIFQKFRKPKPDVAPAAEPSPKEPAA